MAQEVVRAAQGVVAQVAPLQLLLALQIQVAAVALHKEVLVLRVVQALRLLGTQDHKKEQAVQLLLLVDTPITRLQHQGHTQHEPFC